jgi:hypothetical protein
VPERRARGCDGFPTGRCCACAAKSRTGILEQPIGTCSTMKRRHRTRSGTRKIPLIVEPSDPDGAAAGVHQDPAVRGVLVRHDPSNDGRADDATEEAGNDPDGQAAPTVSGSLLLAVPPRKRAGYAFSRFINWGARRLEARRGVPPTTARGEVGARGSTVRGANRTPLTLRWNLARRGANPGVQARPPYPRDGIHMGALYQNQRALAPSATRTPNMTVLSTHRLGYQATVAIRTYAARAKTTAAVTTIATLTP